MRPVFLDVVRDPRMIAAGSLLLGCYLLRDTLRTLLYILDSSRRSKRLPADRT